MAPVSPSSRVGDALQALASLELLPEEQRRLAAETAAKLADRVLYVAVIGEFKRGKSTLINALLGDDLLPTGVIPVTAVPTLVRSGHIQSARVELSSGSERRVPMNALADYLTEQRNPQNRRGVREVIVEHPARLLETGLVLADTPGTGSVHVHNTETTTAFLPRVDVALLVLTVDAPLSHAEAALLHEVAGSAVRVAVCLNKVDLLQPEEVEEALRFVRPRVADLVGTRNVNVFAVSSRHAARQDPGIARLRDWLERDVAAARTALLEERAGAVARRLVAVGDAAIQLEHAARTMSVEEAERAISAFAHATDELALQAQEAVTLLMAACRRATEDIVEPRAQMFRETLPPQLLEQPDDTWPSVLTVAADQWRADTAAAVAHAIETPLRRHTERVRQEVTRFVSSTGMAFGTTLPRIGEADEELTLPEVCIQLADEPGALAMGVRQLRQRLPGRIGSRWRARTRRQEAEEQADRFAGHLRHAAAQAVETSAKAWVARADADWRAVSGALSDAVARAQRASEQALAAATTSDAIRLLNLAHETLGDA